MSKIYDALRKHESERRRRGRDASDTPPAPRDPPVPPRRRTAKGDHEPRPDPVTLPKLSGYPRHFWRSVNRLATAIQAGGSRNERAILYVGAEPGVGVSTLALATCAVLVDDPGVEVLLMDAHARAQDSALLPASECGLIQLALGDATLWEAIAPTDRRGLSYLPRGAGSYNGRKLFEKLIPLLSNLRAVYDYLILDAAPVITAPESAQLAGICDGVVVVLSAERTPKAEALRTKEILDEHRAVILGTVLNRSRRRRFGGGW